MPPRTTPARAAKERTAAGRLPDNEDDRAEHWGTLWLAQHGHRVQDLTPAQTKRLEEHLAAAEKKYKKEQKASQKRLAKAIEDLEAKNAKLAARRTASKTLRDKVAASGLVVNKSRQRNPGSDDEVAAAAVPKPETTVEEELAAHITAATTAADKEAARQTLENFQANKAGLARLGYQIISATHQYNQTIGKAARPIVPTTADDFDDLDVSQIEQVIASSQAALAKRKGLSLKAPPAKKTKHASSSSSASLTDLGQAAAAVSSVGVRPPPSCKTYGDLQKAHVDFKHGILFDREHARAVNARALAGLEPLTFDQESALWALAYKKTRGELAFFNSELDPFKHKQDPEFAREFHQ